jgi:NitT/TauT family transport system substrate-binding protein
MKCKQTVHIVGVVIAASWCAICQTQLSKVQVGYCAKTISAVAAPYAVATKMGYFKQEGLDVTLVPLASSADCVKNITNKAISYAVADVSALAVARLQGLKAKTFYTAYQGNIFGIAVPAESSIQKISDLKGRTIGLIAMGGPGLLVAKALLANAGLDPDKDVHFVVAGEGAQTATMVLRKQVDALSQYDAQYQMVENAGVKLRMLDTKEIDRYPSNGFMAFEDTLRTRRKDGVGLARAYAKGTIFTLTNPEAAVRIFFDVFPALKPTGKDEAAFLRDETKILQVRMPKWKLERGGVKSWGESNQANYAAYLDFLVKWGVLKQKVDVKDVVTDELIDEINKFDANQIVAAAKAYKPK